LEFTKVNLYICSDLIINFQKLLLKNIFAEYNTATQHISAPKGRPILAQRKALGIRRNTSVLSLSTVWAK